MASFKPPTPVNTGTRSTKGGSGMTPPSPDAANRSTPGRSGMAPVKAVGSTRQTKGGKSMTPPSPHVPPSNKVDPIPTRPTDTFTPKKAG